MSSAWEHLVEQALTLSPQDRAFVVVALERSLDVEGWPADAISVDDIEALSGAGLLPELERRSSAVRRGEAVATPVTEVMAELMRRQDAEESA